MVSHMCATESFDEIRKASSRNAALSDWVSYVGAPWARCVSWSLRLRSYLSPEAVTPKCFFRSRKGRESLGSPKPQLERVGVVLRPEI